MLRKTLSIAAAMTLAAVTLAAAPASANHTNGPLVTPQPYPGNFVSSDDQQVCFDMSKLGLIDEQTGDLVGKKIDPPMSWNDDHLTVVLSADGKSLSWSITGGATLLAFIVKGGPSYNVYDYSRGSYTHDNGLVSPSQVGRNGKVTVPAVSHYNVCYTKPAGELQGCTPGYWRNHANRWTGAAPADDFDATFGVDLFDPNITLGAAVQASGGGVNALARHATAALLNSYGGVPNADGTTVAYPYTTAEVIAAVQEAAASGDLTAAKNAFEAANELGCPLSGTRANPVP